MLPEDAKERGYLAELIFAVEAKKNGLTVLTPGGDSAPFDAVVYNSQGRFIKVQIKSCLQREPGRDRHNYTCKRGGPRLARAYEQKDVDMLGLYAFDTNVWHFIPIEQVAGESQIKIDAGGKFDIFRENWNQFK